MKFNLIIITNNKESGQKSSTYDEATAWSNSHENKIQNCTKHGSRINSIIPKSTMLYQAMV